MPATRTNPLVVSLMAITKDDELETAHIHDTPIHVEWSSRGNMAIAVGSAYRIFSSVRPGEIAPEPWSIQPTIVSEGTGFSPFPIEMSRGRSSQQSLHQPTFGRGDVDGFPALTSAKPSPKASPLPVPKSKEGSTVSPAYRSVPASPYFKGNVELPSSPGPASLPLPSPASSARPIAGTSKISERNASSSRTRNAGGRAWRRAIDRTQAIVDEDISMIMRQRVIMGYGLSHVRFIVTA
jgi:WD repeat-containing protein mio